MLVLSRTRNEDVILTVLPGTKIPKEGLKIRATIVDIRGDKVRLGFDGPPSVSIHRREVQDEIDGR